MRVMSVVLMLGMTLATGACSSDGSTPSASSSTDVPASPSTDAQAIDTSPAAPPNAAQQLVAWWSGGASDAYSAITKDEQDIASAGSNQDVAAMNGACTTLQGDVETAQAAGSAPDAEIQQSLSQALAMYARSATDCIAGTQTMDAGLITKASSEMNDGTSALAGAVTKIQTMAGH